VHTNKNEENETNRSRGLETMRKSMAEFVRVQNDTTTLPNLWVFYLFIYLFNQERQKGRRERA